MKHAVLPCGRPAPEKNQPKKVAGIKQKNVWKDILNAHLKSKGLRMTTQREKIAAIAFAFQDHFDVQTLIKEVQSLDPSLSPATIYRSVATLCDAGLLHETFQSQTGVAVYEAAHAEDHHDHIICLDCDAIFEFHEVRMEKAQDQALKERGFTESHHQHVVYAHCTYHQKQSQK